MPDTAVDTRQKALQINLDPRFLRNICRNWSRTGGRSLVFSRWRGCWYGREEHVGLRHDRL